ncbi:DUF418 domain-containing protein [Nonomuraea rhizosphaerae]|uniref:DUF418 domain-containing protein n=1 Tax=Nonomuraea rhizosphaerae TaxID=2665663 RepID=UPI001C5E4A1F|nr:DUF418 domain-containing protein [Nonomuraea rhizosphaerae]
MTTTRIRELDALRGFAVGGIMVVNTWQHAVQDLTGPRNGLDWTIEALFQSRFYPIFSLLFGMGFVLFMRRAGRWVLLRRLLWLLCFGLLQHVFYQGEVLTGYAVWGALVLLPASFLTGGIPLGILGVAAVVWATSVGAGPILIPALFLLGMAIMELRPSRSLLVPVFAVSALATTLLTGAWASTGDWTVYSVAALTGATAYCTGLLLALRPWLSAALEPLGRMALTNYVTGTFVIFLAGGWLHADPTRWSVLAIALGTLVVQVPFSMWWLSRYRYGPLEWIWRSLTWFRRVPNRLESGRDQNRPLPDPGVS